VLDTKHTLANTRVFGGMARNEAANGFFVTATPERIELTQTEKTELISRIKSNHLTEDDANMLIALIEFNFWLQTRIAEKNISIYKLRHAFFGPSEKKTSRNSEKSKDPAIPVEPGSKPAVSKNHGRLSADDYTDIETVNVEHTEYKTGQECPELCGGRLWPVSPGNIVKITGQGFAKATKYVQKNCAVGCVACYSLHLCLIAPNGNW